MQGEEGVTALFSQLCCLHLRPDSPYVLPTLPTVEKCRRKTLRKRLYDVIFQFHKGPHCHAIQRETAYPFTVLDEVYIEAYNMRCRRKFDNANRLEHLVEEFLSDGCTEGKQDILRLLICLAGSGAYTANSAFGSKLALPIRSHNKLPNFPEAVTNCYGDTAFQRILTQPGFMHYPREMFEVEGLDDQCQFGSFSAKIFDALPGSGIGAFFNINGSLGEAYAKKRQQSLFGALVHSNVNTVDTQLDIPDIPHTPSFKLTDEESKDEGFVEDEASSCGTAIVDQDDCEQLEMDVWKLAVQMTRPKYYNWEVIGSQLTGEEKPYLTEAGRKAFDHFYLVYMDRLRLLDTSIERVRHSYVPMKTLMKDLLNVMIAVPSDTFICDQDSQQFSLRSGVCVSGLSPESLGSVCSDFIECGMAYSRLNQFAHPHCADSFHNIGLVTRAFCTAVWKYLQYYTGCVLSITTCSSLLQLTERIHMLKMQIRFLSELCKTDGNSEDNVLPTGVELVSYLYERTLAECASIHYPMMLALLRTTCVPYMLFVQRWVFYGMTEDAYNEFMIQANDDFLQYRDRTYWTDGFKMTANDSCSHVPFFLSDLASAIYACGKSLNLLRLVSPKHFLFSVDCEIPRVRIVFSETSLQQMERECAIYKDQLCKAAVQTTVSREQMVAEKQKKEQQLLVEAIQQASKEHDRLKSNRDAKKQALDVKKRRLFSQLKDQMESDLQRRASEQQEEKEADKKQVESVTQQELLESHIEKETEAQARKDLIEHYAKLSEAAAERQRRAERHVMQRKLDMAEGDFTLLRSTSDTGDSDTAITVDAGAVSNDEVISDGKHSAENVQSLLPVVLPEAEWSKHQQTSGLPRWAEKRLASSSVTDNAGLTLRSVQVETPQDGELSPVFENTEDLPANESGLIGSKQPHHQMGLLRDASAAINDGVDFIRPHVKPVTGCHSSAESVPADVPAPLGTAFGQHVSDESEPVVPEMSLPSSHGHVSEQSGDGACVIPRLHHVTGKHVGQESTDVQMLPVHTRSVPGCDVNQQSTQCHTDITRRRHVPGYDVNQESQSSANIIPHFPRRANSMHASRETEAIDIGAIRNKRFRETNVHGHASDSSIERIMYAHRFSEQTAKMSRAIAKDLQEETDLSEYLKITVESMIKPYQANFDMLNDHPSTNSMSRLRCTDNQVSQAADIVEDTQTDVLTYDLVPLPSLLRRSVTSPLMTQIGIVNESLLNYFTVDLHIGDHFVALRQFLLMQDGEFGQTLSDQLFEKLSMGMQPAEMFNPMHLNAVLSTALRSSLSGDNQFADNISFALKYLPSMLRPNAVNTLDCLELSYKVEWPVNIVISEVAVSNYSRIFSFLLQLKRVSWILSDVWHSLKRSAMMHHASSSSQFRRLQLCRHEMQLFVKVIQSYIANQVIHVTWQEFQTDLQDRVRNLDDLHDRHMEYLNKCVFRCLLNPKAAPVMKIIQDIFSLILKFRSQLISQVWLQDTDSGAAYHPSFNVLFDTYRAFSDYSRFLFKVVSKLPLRGYQPHLQELLLRLNYNNFYKQELC